MLPRCFPSIQLTVREQITPEDLQDSRRCCSKIFKKADKFSNSESLCRFDASNQVGHLGYLNGRILAILNLCVTVMLPIKFWLNPTYGLGWDVIWRISRWRPWGPSWLSERYNFSNSKSLCCSNASHQVLAQSHLRFGRRCHLKYFKMATMAAIFDMGTERF